MATGIYTLAAATTSANACTTIVGRVPPIFRPPSHFDSPREVCGVPKATYKRQGSRADLITQEDFRAAFVAQKARLREMDIRTVEEPDAKRQALLEMYVAISFATPYNDFANH
jgi:hypothetical protein